MKLVSVLFENRPNLQVVNVHLQYHTFDPTPVQCMLHTDHISLSQGAQHLRLRLELPAKLQMQARSLSAMVHTPGWFSFRVCTDQQQGAFATEFLPTGPESATGKRAAKSTAADADTLGVHKTMRVSLLCQDCRRPLTDALCFERILELPSENMDESEWFCCHKNGGGECSTSSDDHTADAMPAARFAPRPHDLLYRKYYFMVAKSIVRQVKEREGFVDCSCGEELGENLKQNDAFKFWNETVAFTYVPEASLCPVTTRLFPGHINAHFLSIIRRAIQDQQELRSPHCAAPLTVRCLFDGYPDRQHMYLLVHVMNTSLEVWREPTADPERSSSARICAEDVRVDVVAKECRIRLKRCVYAKLMFRMVMEEKGTALTSVLRAWQNDPAVQALTLSGQMMQEAHKLLVLNSRLAHPTYRKSADLKWTFSFLS